MFSNEPLRPKGQPLTAQQITERVSLNGTPTETGDPTITVSDLNSAIAGATMEMKPYLNARQGT